jgi:hypothetical protein
MKYLPHGDLSSGALVHPIEGNMFTPDDEKRFGTTWTPPAVSARAGTRHVAASATWGVWSCQRRVICLEAYPSLRSYV